MDLSGSSSTGNVFSPDKIREPKGTSIQGSGSLKDFSVISGSKGTMIHWKGDKKLENLPGLSGMDTVRDLRIDISKCASLKNIDSLKGLKSISSINFDGCESIENLGAVEGLDALSSLDLTGCVSLTDVSGIAGLKNLRELKMEGCSGVKPSPGHVNMKFKKEVEKYQVRLFREAGKPVPEYLKKSIQERKDLEVSETLTDIKKLFGHRSFNHVKQGLELARSSGDPVLFDCLLEGVSYNDISESDDGLLSEYEIDVLLFDITGSFKWRGIYYIPLSNDIGPRGWFEANKIFKWTRADYPYFIQAVLGLVAYAPPGCQTAQQLKGEITGLSVILPEDPDETYIDTRGFSLLAGFENLEDLELIRCRSLADLDGLTGLKKLRYLWFRDCGQLKRLEGLKDLPALETIDLSGCASLENVDGLAGSKRIRSVKLNGCSTLNNLDGLKGLRGLNEISLSGCGSLKNLDGLQGLRDITTISIDNCGSLENVDALGGMKKIRKLNLTNCGKLRDVKGLKSIKGLTELVINDIRFENLDTFSELVQLETIVLSSSNGISKLKDLSGLNKMTKLLELDLRGSAGLETLYGGTGLQDRAGPRGLEGCKSLKKINLINCKKLKNVDALLGLPDLERILLRGSGIKRGTCPVRLLHIVDWRSIDFD